jgi:hypothetical protein
VCWPTPCPWTCARQEQGSLKLHQEGQFLFDSSYSQTHSFWNIVFLFFAGTKAGGCFDIDFAALSSGIAQPGSRPIAQVWAKRTAANGTTAVLFLNADTVDARDITVNITSVIGSMAVEPTGVYWTVTNSPIDVGIRTRSALPIQTSVKKGMEGASSLCQADPL